MDGGGQAGSGVLLDDWSKENVEAAGPDTWIAKPVDAVEEGDWDHGSEFGHDLDGGSSTVRGLELDALWENAEWLAELDAAVVRHQDQRARCPAGLPGSRTAGALVSASCPPVSDLVKMEVPDGVAEQSAAGFRMEPGEDKSSILCGASASATGVGSAVIQAGAKRVQASLTSFSGFEAQPAQPAQPKVRRDIGSYFGWPLLKKQVNDTPQKAPGGGGSAWGSGVFVGKGAGIAPGEVGGRRGGRGWRRGGGRGAQVGPEGGGRGGGGEVAQRPGQVKATRSCPFYKKMPGEVNMRGGGRSCVGGASSRKLPRSVLLSMALVLGHVKTIKTVCMNLWVLPPP